ncbi:MAG: hypothetical protein ACW98W_13200 [Candidatus Hodarchaeales archaeon]
MAIESVATKLILIGDGRVGKTSLCSHLRTRTIPGTAHIFVLEPSLELIALQLD